MPSKPEGPLEVEEKYLDAAQTQLNVRIPLRLRMRIDKYLSFMSLPHYSRPPHTEDWPRSIAGLVNDAVEDFLSTHPTIKRTGPSNPTAIVKQPKRPSNIKPRNKPKDKSKDKE